MNKTITTLALALACALGACTQHMGQMEVNIDKQWQHMADSLLPKAMADNHYTFGQIVLVEAETKQIKVCATHGTPADSVTDPWQYAYHSALVRPFVYAQALQSGQITLADTIDTDSGIVRFDDQVYRDPNWRRGGYGKITVAQSFAQRSQIGAYRVAERTLQAPKHQIFCQANGLDSLRTTIQLVEQYTHFALTPGADSVKAMMNYQHWTRLQRARWRHRANSLTAYHAATITHSFEPKNVAFCGYFPHQGHTYIVYAMMEKKALMCNTSHLAPLVPKLITHICQSPNQEEQNKKK